MRRRLRGPAPRLLTASLLAALFPSPAPAAAPGALARIVEEYEGREFRLLVDLHAPEPGGNPAPWLDHRGWHNHDSARPVVLRSAERVRATGVFNYGDRGIFLELSRVEPLWAPEPPARVRIRISAEAPPEKPEEQAEQLRALIDRVVAVPRP